MYILKGFPIPQIRSLGIEHFIQYLPPARSIGTTDSTGDGALLITTRALVSGVRA